MGRGAELTGEEETEGDGPAPLNILPRTAPEHSDKAVPFATVLSTSIPGVLFHLANNLIIGGRSETFAGRREVGPRLVLGASHELLLLSVWILVAGQAAVDDAPVVVRVVSSERV